MHSYLPKVTNRFQESQTSASFVEPRKKTQPAVFSDSQLDNILGRAVLHYYMKKQTLFSYGVLSHHTVHTVTFIFHYNH